ncbi:M42 family metallopeptidase [Mammaliicoccus stepanovicii]|uniref:Glutamyl aminopeptidase Deblocking aminopeptidase n=1 Tax=Mammaliicoccus stepanovicii TaxID=643214 RepID=A0A239YZ99_9STAP|nr:M42 family metallopeptidase [Mammaliicoccus stepanovicii]PNZ72490.1 peptidase M28 [Mammaliicoccus stepanovicii]GGI40453.1 glutamyl aminopeptidase [Mammaliicoccus stepanovicii]SNV64050.1 Glutamyl aminopeptidase; Deblocking aminopeptidase [Mammaliicoccus stepanovicii]
MTQIRQETITKMKELTELHAVPGFEGEVRDYLKEKMTPFVDEIIGDNMGSIYGVKKSKKKNAPKVLIAAHMDEIGFMVTEMTNEGMLKFTPLGGVSSDVWLSQTLQLKTKKNDYYNGVVGSIPKHFRTGNESGVSIDDMLLDVGAENKKQLQDMGINIGDTIVPRTDFEQLTENRILAKAWDNRYGCLVGIELLESLKNKELDVDLYVGANVQEEVGLRGASASVNLIKPDIALVVDCSPANDMKGHVGLSGALGEGVLVRILDRTMILSERMKEYLLNTIEENEIQYQYFQSPGGTDGGEIHKALTGIPTAVIGVCARYIHTSKAVYDIRDYLNAKSLLEHLVLDIDFEKIEYLKYK